MRRPSAIPISSAPVEERDAQTRPDEEPPARPVAPAPVAGAAPQGVRDDGSALQPQPAIEASDAPLTARDLWLAARARRRALRAEIRRFTQRSRRRRIGWIVGAVLALVVVGGCVGAAYSPLFAVQTITVQGTAAVPPAEVQKALSGQLGRPLALVDSSAVKAALVRFPLIETYRLEAHPPHELVVRIVERTPVGVIQADDGRYTVVDAAGVVLSTSEERPAGYALIGVAGGTGTAAFTAVGTALRALPAELRSQVDGATASTPDDIVLQLHSGAKVTWGSADQSAEKTVVLKRLMAASPDAGSYDVSSPGVAIVG